jgi:restriction system protein
MFKMAENSLFAVLLRSPWWVSIAIGVVLGALGVALLPEDWRVAAALSGFPFLVIGAMAAWRQSKLPSAARIDTTRQAVAAMAWPAFAALLEQAFARDGYTVQRGAGNDGVDFVLERRGRRMLVSARRWKSARTGLEPLRALQAAREAAGDDVPNDALLVCLGELTDNARPFAAEHRIAVWQAAELAQALRGLPLR